MTFRRITYNTYHTNNLLNSVKVIVRLVCVKNWITVLKSWTRLTFLHYNYVILLWIPTRSYLQVLWGNQRWNKRKDYYTRNLVRLCYERKISI